MVRSRRSFWVYRQGDFEALKVLICDKHGKPIPPRRLKEGCKTKGCTECDKEYRKRGRQKRAKAFDEGDIRCKKHSERKASRSCYVANGRRHCNWCNTHKANGTPKPGRKRSSLQSNNKQHYKKSIQRRGQLAGRLRGLALFERATGLDLFAMGLAR